MYLGRFVEEGRSEIVFHRPRHADTAALWAANPSTNPDAVSERVKLTGDVPSLLQRPPGCKFHTRCPRVQAKCRQSFPERENLNEKQVWNCFHPLD